MVRIEHTVAEETGQEFSAPAPADRIRVNQRGVIGFGTIAATVFRTYPRRTALGLAPFVGQAFLYKRSRSARPSS